MKSRLDEILKDVPAAIRRAMLEDAPQLEPGAAQVMGRFWSAVRVGKGSLAMPPAEAYRDAAASGRHFGVCCARSRDTRRMCRPPWPRSSARNGMPGDRSPP